MITHCIRDDFKDFLDKNQYVLSASVFDAIGLPPGSPPRTRNLIGHRLYSDMMEGVGRGTIFNHRDPMNSDEDYTYTLRTVERFQRVLASSDRKMFVVLNLNKQLWIEPDLFVLFEELTKRTSNFLMIVVNCIKNLGPRAQGFEVELCTQQTIGTGTLLIWRLPCVGDNTGSYFRHPFDEERMQSILIQPYKFKLAQDPLDQVDASSAQRAQLQSHEESNGHDQFVDSHVKSHKGSGSRWGRTSSILSSEGVDTDANTPVTRSIASVDSEKMETSSPPRRWAPRGKDSP
jgi:hypothetical protein